jgi:hypothetical protein
MGRNEKQFEVNFARVSHQPEPDLRQTPDLFSRWRLIHGGGKGPDAPNQLPFAGIQPAPNACTKQFIGARLQASDRFTCGCSPSGV